MRPIVPSRSPVPALVLVVALSLAAVGCTGDDDAEPPASSEATTGAPEPTGPATTVGAPAPTGPAEGAPPVDAAAVPDGAEPAPTPVEAVEALLTAERAGDHAASYALLAASARAALPSERDWQRQRDLLPPIRDFEVDAAATDGGRVEVVVDHEPRLDPFVGLGARERQVWTAVETADGWLVAADPEREYLLPPDQGAADAARRWAEAVQDCDPAAAEPLEAVDILFGDVTAAGGLCGTDGAIEVGGVGPLVPGPAAQDIVDQYSTDAQLWARTVRVDGPASFGVVLAPLGDEWRVLAITL